MNEVFFSVFHADMNTVHDYAKTSGHTDFLTFVRQISWIVINVLYLLILIWICVWASTVVGGLLSAHLLSKQAGIAVEEGWPCSGPLLRLAEDAARKLLPGKKKLTRNNMTRKWKCNVVA